MRLPNNIAAADNFSVIHASLHVHTRCVACRTHRGLRTRRLREHLYPSAERTGAQAIRRRRTATCHE